MILGKELGYFLLLGGIVILVLAMCFPACLGIDLFRPDIRVTQYWAGGGIILVGLGLLQLLSTKRTS